jgi:hypothetical protein
MPIGNKDRRPWPQAAPVGTSLVRQPSKETLTICTARHYLRNAWVPGSACGINGLRVGVLNLAVDRFAVDFHR